MDLGFKEFRIKRIDPETTEHYKNLKRVVEDSVQKKEKVKRILKKAALATAIGFSFVMIGRSLQTEEIMTSTDPVAQSTTVVNDKQKGVIEKISNIISGKEKCKIKKDAKYSTQNLLTCLSSNSEEDVLNGIGYLRSSEASLNPKVKEKINELILNSDYFIYKQLIELVKDKNMKEAVPYIIKRMKNPQETVFFDSILNESIISLGFFAANGDSLSLKELQEVFKNSTDKKIKSIAAACQILVVKEMGNIKSFYESLSEDERLDFATTFMSFLGFEIIMKKVDYNKQLLKSKIYALIENEKNEEIKKFFVSIIESLNV